jgi:hypothetical protein
VIDLAGGATTSRRNLVRVVLPPFAAAKLLTAAVFAEGGWLG